MITTSEAREHEGAQRCGNPLEQYVWHPFYVDALVLRVYDAATSGSAVRYYYAFDAAFNVTAVTTNTGTAIERYYYTSYGGLLFLDGTFGLLSTQQSQIANPVTYTGRQYDGDIGLYYYRNRYYHAQLGQFVSRDPLGYQIDITASLPWNTALSAFLAYSTPDSSGVSDLMFTTSRHPTGSLYDYCTANPLICADPTGECPRRCFNPCLPNGCGNKAIRAPNIQAGINLKPCCDAHDVCYCSCGTKKSTCDAMFANCLKRRCGTATSASQKNACLEKVGGYVIAVLAGGSGSYGESQDLGCANCE